MEVEETLSQDHVGNLPIGLLQWLLCGVKKEIYLALAYNFAGVLQPLVKEGIGSELRMTSF